MITFEDTESSQEIEIQSSGTSSVQSPQKAVQFPGISTTQSSPEPNVSAPCPESDVKHSLKVD
jgi:hypothetical protein